VLKELASVDKRVKVIRYNRNYGFQRSLLTAYRHASGDAAIQIDCDLQDPPSLFPEFLRLWEAGHDVVVGIRRSRQENRLLTWGRHRFYAFLDVISEDNLTRDAGDFRLVDRTVLDVLHRINDHSPYVRALVSSLAVNEAAVPYDRASRLHGMSKFPVSKLVGFGLNGIFGHSTIPLRLATYFGILISVAAMLLGAFYFAAALLYRSTWPSGFATMAILILFGIGVNGIFLGVLGEYIGRIYQQTRQRPLTVIMQRLNMPEKEPEPVGDQRIRSLVAGEQQ
jgi:dolichol-phosphate mannosyltransferase